LITPPSSSPPPLRSSAEQLVGDPEKTLTTTFTVINPATEQAVVDVPLTDVAGTDAAIAASHEAFQTWRGVSPGERAAVLRRFAAVIDAHVDELAELEVRNAGHTWANARWEAGNVRDCLNYYSGAPERLFGKQIPVAGGTDITSTSRWASSASSCRGTSRCPSPGGAWPPRSPPATRWC